MGRVARPARGGARRRGACRRARRRSSRKLVRAGRCPTPPSTRCSTASSPETLALTLAYGAPGGPILRYLADLQGVRLEITGDDLVEAGVPESPALGRALEETLRKKLDGELDGRDEELALRAGGGAIDELIGVRPARRRGRVLDPPGRRQRGPVRVAQPRASSPTTSASGWSATASCWPTAAGIDPRSIAMGWQVHGTDVKEWPDGVGPAEGGELEKVDGHVTARDDLALLVLVADCLPVALAGADRVAMVHCGWRGLAGGILAKARRALRRTAGRGGRARHRAVLLRGRRRGARAVRRRGFADGRMLDLRAVADAPLRAAGVERIEHVDLCTSCRAGPLLLAPPRRRRDRPPGRARVADIDAARVRANLERVREQIGRRAVEICAAIKYVAADGPARARRGRHHARGREPRAGPGREAGRARRPVRVGLHRRASEPQGQGRRAARAADPVGRVRVGARAAREAPGDGGADPGERGGGGGEGRGCAGGARRLRCPLPGARFRADDDAAVHRAARGQPAALRASRRAGRRARAASGSRWARRRTTRSPSRRARRSSGWAPSCTR